jgi:hypothetical protein
MNISNIITYLNTITAITNIVSNRIFWWVPKTEQTLDYLTINIITENQPTDVEKRNRIEFRYIWWNSDTTYLTLQTLDNLILSNMNNYKQDWVYKTVISNFANWYDEKQRKVMIRDLFIYYTT